MNNWGRFVINGTLMTFVSLLLRFVSVSFNVYISNIIGAEGLGLFTLISTVYSFALTIATSGINLATTRLVSECIGEEGLGENDKIIKSKKIKYILKKCIAYSLIFSVTVSVILLVSADYIGNELLFDKRTIPSLKLLAITLTPIAISSALNGYFVAVRRVYKNAIVTLFSQFSKIFATVLIFRSFVTLDTEMACLAIVAGGAFSEISSFILHMIFFLKEKSSNKNEALSKVYKSNVVKNLLSISLPVALSTYLRSGLISIEHILIPIGLEKSGSNKASSLAAYGTVQSMVFPIVLFPSAILISFAGLLIPEISEAKTTKDIQKIKNIATSSLRITLIFSIGAAGIIGCFANKLGTTIYPESDAGRYIRVIAPLIPVMYLDTMVDSILKGLGQQLYSMVVNIVDSSLSVILVIFLIPKFGIWGFIMTVFFTEIINATFSIIRLLNFLSIKPNIINWIVKPLASIVGATYIIKFLFEKFPIRYLSDIPEIVICILLSILIYIIFLILTGSTNKKEIEYFISKIRYKNNAPSI